MCVLPLKMKNKPQILYRLAPYVRVGLDRKTIYLGFGSMQIKQSLQSRKRTVAILNFLSESKKHPETKNGFLLKAKKINIYELVCSFFDKGFFIEDRLFERDDRYSRNKLYYNKVENPLIVQSRIGTKHVIILGAGGIGNMLGPILATAGVGKITLVDADTIELSNLTRQYMFSESHIGKYKVDVLSDELCARNSTIIVKKLKVDILTIEDLNQLPEADLIILSADSKGLIGLVNTYATKIDTPYINVGYVQDIAVWGPLVIPKQSGCWDCRPENVAESYANSNEEIEELLNNINSEYQAPSFGPVNMLASSLASIDIMRFLGGYGQIRSLNKRIGLWASDLHFEEQDYSKSPTCKTCS